MKFGEYFKAIGVEGKSLEGLMEYRRTAPKSTSERLLGTDKIRYYKDNHGIVKKSIIALVQGKHVLYEGVKGTGKNTLINMLSYVFGRPLYTYSFNKHADIDSIVGQDTLKNGTVEFRPHQLTEALNDKSGAWFVADEINMARGDVLAFLHQLLDERGEIEIPNYGKIEKNPHFRFIGTMNYGYMGTQELNEAFTDRFEVIHIPPMTETELTEFLREEYEELSLRGSRLLGKMYSDIHKLAVSGEISSRAVSIRGIKSAVEHILQYDLDWKDAFDMGFICKAFDEYERTKIYDAIYTLISKDQVNSYWIKESNQETEVTTPDKIVIEVDNG